MVNSNPLAIKNVNVSKLADDHLITPNDLILGRGSSSINPLVDQQSSLSHSLSHYSRMDYLKMLQQRNAAVNEFWLKWYSIVFPTLLPREKWHHTGRQLRNGDIVLIRDTNPIRGNFTWGEVVDCFVSVDNVVWSASVRYNNRLGRSRDGCHQSKTVTKSVRDLHLILPNEERIVTWYYQICYSDYYKICLFCYQYRVYLS